MPKAPIKSRTIYTSLYGSSDYILRIENMKLSPIFDDKTEIPPEMIIFRTTNGKEVRYIREE